MNFLFPSAHGNYVYTIQQSSKCAIALCLKNNVHALIKNILLLKTANHRLNLLEKWCQYTSSTRGYSRLSNLEFVKNVSVKSNEVKHNKMRHNKMCRMPQRERGRYVCMAHNIFSENNFPYLHSNALYHPLPSELWLSLENTAS